MDSVCFCPQAPGASHPARWAFAPLGAARVRACGASHRLAPFGAGGEA